MKITDYDILYNKNPDTLSKLVQDFQKKGWQPFKNLVVIDIDRDGVTWHYQAVVKYEQDTEKKHDVMSNVFECPKEQCEKFYYEDRIDCLDCPRGLSDKFKQK